MMSTTTSNKLLKTTGKYGNNLNKKTNNLNHMSIFVQKIMDLPKVIEAKIDYNHENQVILFTLASQKNKDG